MEPDNAGGDRKLDDQKLSPVTKTDEENMDDFFSGMSRERPVTPGQDSDPVEVSSPQKHTDDEVGDAKVQTEVATEDDGSKLPELKEDGHKNDEVVVESENKALIVVTGPDENPDLIVSPSDDPLSSKPAGTESETESEQESKADEQILRESKDSDLYQSESEEAEASVKEFVKSDEILKTSENADELLKASETIQEGEEHSQEPEEVELPKVSSELEETLGESKDSELEVDKESRDSEEEKDKEVDDDSDKENQEAAINFVQDVFEKATPISKDFGVESASDQEDQENDVGEEPEEPTVKEDGGDISDSEVSSENRGKETVEDTDHKGRITDISGDFLDNKHMSQSEDVVSVETEDKVEMAKTDESLFVKQQKFQSFPVNIEDLEEIKVKTVDTDKHKPHSHLPLSENIYRICDEMSPKLTHSQLLEEQSKYIQKPPIPELQLKREDIQRHLVRGEEQVSAADVERMKSKDGHIQSLDQDYSSALDDQTSVSHASAEIVTDEDWSENERKDYSRVKKLLKDKSQKEGFESKLDRQLPSQPPASASLEYELKHPLKPVSKTDSQGESYSQTSNIKLFAKRYDMSNNNVSIGGSYLTSEHDRDNVYPRPRSLVTDAHQTASWSPGVAVSPPSSGPVPGYKSLQDQQMSWLQMFKILEKQHRKELQSQYLEHQRLIEGIQMQMEQDLLKQQESLHQRLEVHRELLSDSTSPNVYTTSNRHHGYRLSTEETTGRGLFEDSSQSRIPSSSLPIRRALDRDFESRTPSPTRGYISLDSGINSRPVSRKSPQRSPPRTSDREFGGEKMLRGGVYSTPMPISRGRNTSKSFSSENRSVRKSPRPTSPVTDELSDGHVDQSLDSHPGLVDSHHNTERDDSYLSNSSKLREKHIRAMSDLRSYYESEIQDLRDALAVASPVRETVKERILQEENQELKQRCDDLVEQVHATRIHNRELEQKIHGLEIRANDYANRYDDSQRTVLSLKSRLEELHSYAKERDQMIEELEIRLKEQNMSLQNAYKKIDELTENNRRDKTTLQKILEKYEGLEKEYHIVKDSARQTEEKYYNAKQEVVDLNKILSKLELQIKHLNRENDNLRHKAAVAMNMASVTTTSYEDSFGLSTDHRRNFINGNCDINVTSRSTTGNRPLIVNDPSFAEETSSDADSEKSNVSPLIKAERELLKLQKQQNFATKLSPSSAKKYYGSDLSFLGKQSTEYEYSKKYCHQSPKYSTKQSPPRSKTSPQCPNRSPSHTSSSKQRSRTSSTPKPDSRENSRLAKTPPKIHIQPKKYSSPTRFDVDLDYQTKYDRQKDSRIVDGEDSYERKVSNSRLQTPNKSQVTNKTVADTLDRVKAGDFVSRPQWEDVHTSLAKPKSSTFVPLATMSREQRLEERLKTIEKLEKKYEELQAEKRKLESALTRIPSHGHLRQKEELEDQYDKVEKELGSVRMSLKRFQVIKSTI